MKIQCSKLLFAHLCDGIKRESADQFLYRILKFYGFRVQRAQRDTLSSWVRDSLEEMLMPSANRQTGRGYSG